MPKRLSLPGLYIIDKITFISTDGNTVIVFGVTDSYSKNKRIFRFDVANIAKSVADAQKSLELFIKRGEISPDSYMSQYPTPPGHRRSLIVACFENIRNKPCLVRYSYAGENIGMLFYPHEVTF